MLAARGVEPTREAVAGALLEVEHARKVDALIDGLAAGSAVKGRG
jgi:hypothetical protein